MCKLRRRERDDITVFSYLIDVFQKENFLKHFKQQFLFRYTRERKQRNLSAVNIFRLLKRTQCPFV